MINMNKQEELKIILTNFRLKYDKERFKIIYNWIKENCKIKPGDIVEDHIGYFKIDKFHSVYQFFGKYYPMFIGVSLTKKKIPSKTEKRTEIYGQNIKGGWMYD